MENEEGAAGTLEGPSPGHSRVAVEREVEEEAEEAALAATLVDAAAAPRRERRAALVMRLAGPARAETRGRRAEHAGYS